MKVLVNGFKEFTGTGTMAGLCLGAMLFIPGMFFVAYGLSYWWGLLAGVILWLGTFLSYGLSSRR